MKLHHPLPLKAVPDVKFALYNIGVFDENQNTVCEYASKSDEAQI